MSDSKQLPSKEPPRLEVPISVVEALVEEQFPQWANLKVAPVALSGWDNRTFHLGREMTVRLPSAERYTHQVLKEQKWLPRIAAQLSYPIPEPLALGRPSDLYPWHWSVYRWIEGENADNLENEDLNKFARDIAEFLKELQKADTKNGPAPGPFRRGASPTYYDAATRRYLTHLNSVIDTQAATAVWDRSIRSEWSSSGVWVHGDFSTGNILVEDGKLKAVIDFGSASVGDPSCDLVIAWTFLRRESRRIFRQSLGLDQDTWARARGWAIWKAMFNIANAADVNSANSLKQKNIIREIISSKIYKSFRIKKIGNVLFLHNMI